LYKLALVDSGLVNELKENVGRNKLHEVKKKFMSDMNDTHGGGKRSFEYVEKAAAGHYPEAMFILCVRYYYVSGEDPNQEERFKSELLRCKSDIKENHPDSEYLHYFDELSKAAGI
ncbi:MAG: hypothetical protein J6331_02765, partial [Lentisphaeria bacterium]|nr:hypothetical protein [Lentisphaeria bacterium]